MLRDAVLNVLEVTVQDKRMKSKGIIDKNQRVYITKTHATERQLHVDVIIHMTW
jgi:hypothetical protein